MFALVRFIRQRNARLADGGAEHFVHSDPQLCRNHAFYDALRL